MSDDHQSGKFGNPLGIAGLGAILGAGGLLAWAGFGAGVDKVDPVHDTPGEEVIVRPVGPDTGPVDNPVDHHTGTVPDTPDHTDVPNIGDTPIIKPITPIGPETQPVRPPVPPTHAHSKPDRVVFIVKVKNAPEFERAVRLYRKDKAAAEAAFESFIRKNPEFKGMKIVRGSYSGEARLEYTFPVGRNASKTAIQALQDKMKTVRGVAYADIDFVVHPTDED